MSDNAFILIGNFRQKTGILDQSVFDDTATHPFQVFFQNVNASAKLLDLKITEVFEHFVAVEGDQVDTGILEQQFGSKYSCIHVSAEHLEQIRDIEYNPEPPEPIFDKTPYASDLFTSDINVASLPANKTLAKPKFRYDA